MIALSNQEFKHLADYVRSNFGINFRTEKKYLVLGRLQSLLAEKEISSFEDYLQYVIADKTGEAVTVLINKLTTNHTFFMREREHFDFLSSTALPFWAKSLAKSKDLRIWSAGCSTGEEPYTIAMILADYLGPAQEKWDASILASDISEQVITAAEQGIYLNEQIEVLPDHWQRNYFTRIDDMKSKVVDRIKQEVIFRRFNLMSRVFPFKKKFQVIFCRNVMIYFDNPTKIDLINKFYDATESGGYLFIGHSESIDRNETKYRYVMPAVYRKE